MRKRLAALCLLLGFLIMPTQVDAQSASLTFKNGRGQADGSAASTDNSVTTGTSNTQCWRRAANPFVVTGNEQCAFFSLNIPLGHGNGVAYEAEPLYARCVTADSNTFALKAYDCVGGEFQAVTSGTGQLLRIWGTDTTTRIVPGSDGYATGYENDILNAGTNQPTLNTATVKHNFFGVCSGPNNCTSLMDMSATGGSAYYHGIPVIKQYMNSNNSDVFSVVDGSVGGLPNIAAIYADGHTLALRNSIVTGPAASNRTVSFDTGANDSTLSSRWNIGADIAAETGSDAGSNFQICAYSDAGTLLSCPLGITRSSGVIAATAPVVLRAYTVATLPTCVGGLAGAIAYVTDTSAPTYNARLRGAGAVKTLAMCNGTSWTAH